MDEDPREASEKPQRRQSSPKVVIEKAASKHGESPKLARSHQPLCPVLCTKIDSFFNFQKPRRQTLTGTAQQSTARGKLDSCYRPPVVAAYRLALVVTRGYLGRHGGVTSFSDLGGWSLTPFASCSYVAMTQTPAISPDWTAFTDMNAESTSLIRAIGAERCLSACACSCRGSLAVLRIRGVGNR